MAGTEHVGSDIRRMVDRHDQDLYRGNGKPGLTTRMALMEDCVEKISKNLNKITWLLVAAIITGIMTILVSRLK